MTRHQDIAIGAIRGAIPYLRLFQGRTFVIKAGGEVFADEFSTGILMEQVGVLHQLGIRVVLVHGGGQQTSDMAKALGMTTQMVAGRRVTDRETRDVSTMVLNGSVNTSIVAACRKLGIPAVGLSGVDAGLIQAKRRPPREMQGHGMVDFGFVGRHRFRGAARLGASCSKTASFRLFRPCPADKDGSVLNINADVVASSLAVALGAEKFILITSAQGIMTDLSDPTSMISLIDGAALDQMVTGGPDPGRHVAQGRQYPSRTPRGRSPGARDQRPQSRWFVDGGFHQRRFWDLGGRKHGRPQARRSGRSIATQRHAMKWPNLPGPSPGIGLMPFRLPRRKGLSRTWWRTSCARRELLWSAPATT